MIAWRVFLSEHSTSQLPGSAVTLTTNGLASTDRSMSQSAVTANAALSYRQLLRALRSACQHSKPARKNLQRLYRTEFEAHLVKTSSGEASHGSVSSSWLRETIRFMLSAAHSPVISSEAMKSWKTCNADHLDPLTIKRAFLLGQSETSLSKERKRARKEASGKLLPRVEESGDPELELEDARWLSTLDSQPMNEADEGHDSGEPAADSPQPFRVPVPSRENTLAHRVLVNLSSLTYHHLSPNSRMIPLSRRTGGTSASTAPKLTTRKVQDAGFRSINELYQNDSDDTAPDTQRALTSLTLQESPREHVASLLVPPKPIRGPKQAPGLPNRRWDGQKVVQSFGTLPPALGSSDLASDDAFERIPAESTADDSDGTTITHGDENLTRLQRRASESQQAYETLRQQRYDHLHQHSSDPSSNGGQDSAQSAAPRNAKRSDVPTEQKVAAARSLWREARGHYRTALKAIERAQEKHRRQSIPVLWLENVVRAAQNSAGQPEEDGGGVWLGAARFKIRALNGWLPP